MEDMIKRAELLRILKNGQRYNSDCPQWVYDVINNMTAKKCQEMSCRGCKDRNTMYCVDCCRHYHDLYEIAD